jgi:hypothetical protein
VNGFIRASSAMAVLVFFLNGCCPAPPQARFYNGPTESLDAVVAQVNRNNSNIPGFFARLDYSATIIDKQRNKTEDFSGDGRLLYTRPRSLLLKCNKDIVGPIFELGSNDSDFWFKVLVGDSAEWWGHYANLGKPCCKPIPIRPDLMLEVLGVGLFDTNFLQEPVPVMRFNNEADAYMFVWNLRAENRWIARKEIWYDRVTKSPELVRLFDEDGRVILQARLSEPAPVSPQGPSVARHYELLFLEDGSRMTLDFTDVTLRPATPASSFNRPLESGVKDEIQIDKDCGG